MRSERARADGAKTSAKQNRTFIMSRRGKRIEIFPANAKIVNVWWV